MQAIVTKDGDGVVVKLMGRFDFNTHQEFRAAIASLATDDVVHKVTIDFAGVEYLDSSVLGMLLSRRERMGWAHKEVVLAGVRGNLKQVLDIANFAKLFHIS